MIDEIGIENKIFTQTFGCLIYSGYWIPTTIKQRWLRLCYHFYTIFSAFSISIIVFGTIGDIAISGDHFFFHLVESWHLTAVCIHIIVRGLNVMRNRARIIRLLRAQFIVERWTNLRDAEEIRLIETSKVSERNLLVYWMTLEAVNGIMNALNPIITSNPDDYLMYKSWLPCDRHVPLCFWSCWSYQVLGYGLAAITHVSADCIVLNFIERICTHFRILQHRLALLPHLVSTGVLNTAQKERVYVNECILDHQNIYSTINEISQMFTITTFIYFTFSFSLLCTNIYFLSKQSLFTSEFVAGSLFLCCLLMQCLINCWYGYKLAQIGDEITYTIFSMNWLELRKDTRNTLRFIMLSASKSVSLFNNFVVELSPEMFLKMLKVSYSAFNLLQTRN